MSIQRVLKNAIRRLKPTKKESQNVQHQVKNIIDQLTSGLKEIYSDIEVRIEGSIAKNTWLSNSKEIDIFLLLPLETPRELLQDVLSTVKKVIRTQSPQEILKLMSPYREILKHSLTKDETLAHTAALRLLLNEAMQQRIIDSMNFTYVMYYLFLCEFECRDLTFIAIAKHHNIEPRSYLVHKI